MDANQDKSEGLHQQAAAFYLQGDFEKALTHWQELLALDPEDERAQEGVRLCEMLSDDGALLAPGEPTPPAENPASIPIATPADGASVEQSAHAAPATDEPPVVQPVVAAPSQLDDEDLGWDLSSLDLDGEEGAAAPSAPPAVPGVATAVRAATVPTPPLAGADPGFGDMPDLEDLHPTATNAGLDSLDEALGATPVTAAPVESAAANELRARVDELMLQATGAHDAGDPTTAMNVLSRVFILDEGNAAAQNLKQAIEAEHGAPVAMAAPVVLPEPVPVEAIPAADDGGFDLDLEAPGDLFDASFDAPSPQPETGEDAAAPPPPVLDVVDVDAPDPTDIPMAGLEDTPIPEGIREAQKLAAQADPGSQRGAGLLSRKFLAIYAVALVVMLAAGWGALKFIGRTPDSELDEAVRQMQAVNKDGSGAKQENNKDSKGNASETTEATAPRTPDELPEILASAQRSFEAGEFSQAVIAYNQALEIDPDHGAAKAGLAVAGERYRQQRAFQEKLDTASTAWERGDYRAAMRIYYRLPEAVDNPRFDRYKQNGWFNLGVQSIQANNCEEARSHFEELSTLTPEDQATADLIALAKSCKFSRSDPGYRARVQGLSLRALDD